MSIKLGFCDFWSGFHTDPDTRNEESNNFFYNMLKDKYDIEISNDPDILIFSAFGNAHQKYNCTKIFYTGENVRPNYSICDYSVTFDYIEGDRNFRFPLSAVNLYEIGIRDKFLKEVDFDKIKVEKTKFCNFVFSNPNANLRNQLFFELSKYKKVDAGGRVFNNIGYPVGDKLEFLNNYKFTIAFENSQSDGYTTEKLIHPKLKNSIPIYWGNPRVSDDWNDKSFINAYKFSNISELVEYVKEVDNDDDLYYKILSEKHFVNDELPFNFKHDNLVEFFDKIFKNKRLI